MDSNVNIKERERVFRICLENLEGPWKSCSQDELIITRLSGGMTNLLYSCALPENIHNDEQTFLDKHPKRVLIRIYGSTEIDLPVQLEVFNQLAQEELGPKLYAIFDGGRIEELLMANALSLKQLRDPDISACIAKKIAASHCLQMRRLHKNPNWLIDQLEDFYKLIKTFQPEARSYGTTPKTLSSNGSVLKSTLAIAEQMLVLDFELEIDYVSRLIHQSKSPLVFSHNDLHQNNILLSHDPRLHHLENRVVLIDFEYCSYNYQPHDLANHLSEWCFDYTLDEYPFFTASKDRFPTSEQQKQFLYHYVDELKKKLVNNNTNNGSSKHQVPIITNVDKLYQEMQPFLMIANLFWSLWAIGKAYTSEINFGYWEMAKAKWDIYWMCKEKYEKMLNWPDKNDNGSEKGDTQVESKM